MPDIEEWLTEIEGRLGTIETSVVSMGSSLEEANKTLDNILKVLKRIEKERRQ